MQRLVKKVWEFTQHTWVWQYVFLPVAGVCNSMKGHLDEARTFPTVPRDQSEAALRPSSRSAAVTSQSIPASS